MSHQANKLGTTLTIIFVVIFVVIFMANSWVSSEIEESKNRIIPSIQTVNTSKRTNGMHPSISSDQFAMDQAGMTNLQYASANQGKRKKRKKIIYEIPLDDVNLVQ